ncbi:MAG: autotransporter outer membrane beta-barrel domain-containing protein [Puniceicoccales bacterium]|jgi:outer membrane autotransporter protein|nr:autotransporter outer membrane beta-barrel domain-containing protein [Puniceicoccales bacterium]
MRTSLRILFKSAARARALLPLSALAAAASLLASTPAPAAERVIATAETFVISNDADIVDGAGIALDSVLFKDASRLTLNADDDGEKFSKPWRLDTGAAGGAVVKSDRNAEFAGTLDGSARLVFDGRGTVTLSGAVTGGGVSLISGMTVQNATTGTYESSGGTILITGTFDGGDLLFNGGKIEIDSEHDIRVAGRIGYLDPTVSNVEGTDNPAPPDAVLTKKGAGTLTVSGNSNHRFADFYNTAGVTNFENGTLIVTILENGEPRGPTPREAGVYTAELHAKDVTADFFVNNPDALFVADTLHVVSGFDNDGVAVIGTLTEPVATEATPPDALRNRGTLTIISNVHLHTECPLYNLAGATLNLGSRAVTIDGTLRNSGTVVFPETGAEGSTLTVGNLSTTDVRSGRRAAGKYVITLNFSEPAKSDKIVIGTSAINSGTVTGAHDFYLRELPGANGEKIASQFYDRVNGVPFITLSDVHVNPVSKDNFAGASSLALYYVDANGALVDKPVTIGLYQLGFLRDSESGAYTGNIGVTGYSDSGQFVANATGALPMSWFSQLDNIFKRQGELRIGMFDTPAEGDASFDLAATGSDAPRARAPRTGARKKSSDWVTGKGRTENLWIRGYGQRANVDLGVKNLSSFTEYQFGADVGFDTIFGQSSENIFYGGVFAGFDSSRRNINNESGSWGNTHSVIGGLYATWLTRSGFFANAIVKGQYFRTKFRTLDSEEGVSNRFHNRAVGGSGEIGYRFDFGQGKVWFAEPSLLFSYLFLFDEDFTLSAEPGTPSVRLNDGHVFRYGGQVRLGRKFDFANYGTAQPHVRAGVRGQNGIDGQLYSDGLYTNPRADDVHWSVGAGLAWQLDEMNQIYVDYEAAFGRKYEVPWSINVGWRARF